eukprot:Nk52_evm32s250 gene=Nk52_evmTU32s250
MSQLWTTKADGEVKLRMTESGAGADTPKTVIEVFRKTVDRFPDNDALRVERNGEWQTWSYQRYWDESKSCAKAMIKVGVQKYHGVAIIGFNSPEWLISYMGGIMCGGFAAGIYTTNGPEAVHYVADHCKANIAIVENDVQLQKFLAIRSRLPHLKAIVQYTGELKKKEKDVYSWKEFIALGEKENDKEFDKRVAALKPNQCCALIYTSGTTGNPKAVMMSHDNITWTAGRCADVIDIVGDQHVVSYLPLSHVAAQMIDVHALMPFGGTTHFARPDALKGSLVDTLKQVRPTFFLGVPRVWEKIAEKMQAAGKKSGAMAQYIGSWAKDIGLRGNLAMEEGKSVPWGWTFCSYTIFHKIRQAIGLDRCTDQFTAAAPISRETLEYFMSINLPLHEIYGMSESAGPHTAGFYGQSKIGTVGKKIPGVELKLDNPDKDGNGEICMYGRNVFMGYLYNDEKTRECIDDQGWLHSGDIGRCSPEGYLSITGRIKELIITAGGENVPPVLIEDVIKEELPCVSNVMVIGDRRKFLSCLITLKNNPDKEGNPSKTLTNAVIEEFKAAGSTATTTTAAAKCPKVKALIEAGMKKANARATSRAQNVQKFHVLENDFSIPTGELTPTLKLKRSVVSNQYAEIIEGFYN